MADAITRTKQMYNPNTHQVENFDEHNADSGQAMLDQERLQSALGLGGKDTSNPNDPEPNMADYRAKFGLGGAEKWRADHNAWQQRQGQKRPVLARPMPTPGNQGSQMAPQNPTPQSTPVAGLIQQMLGMGQNG